MRPAMSTVACPDWTLRMVAEEAERGGWGGVELRTEGTGGVNFACDPALSDAAKVRDLFARSGLKVVTLSTGVAFDAPVFPPVIGYAFTDAEGPIRETKRAVELAAQIDCPTVRVFAFQLHGNESRAAGLRRIVPRLRLAAATARNTGVRVLLENGGSFPTARDLNEIISAVDHPLLAAAYCPAVAAAAGEDPQRGLDLLGSRLLTVKLRDHRAGKACLLGEGELPTQTIVDALRRSGFAGWLVYEHDRAWLGTTPDAADVRAVLSHAARTLYSWAGSAVTRRPVLV